MSAEITVLSNKKEWEKIRKVFLNQTTTKLNMGFFAEDTYGSENNNLPVPVVAAWQDLGTPFAGAEHIPARPFMSVGLKDLLKSSAYKSIYKKSFLDMLAGQSVLKQYKDISDKVVPDMVQVIDEWSSPPNAASTISQKGEDNPLVESGKMRDSFKTKVEK